MPRHLLARPPRGITFVCAWRSTRRTCEQNPDVCWPMDHVSGRGRARVSCWSGKQDLKVVAEAGDRRRAVRLACEHSPRPRSHDIAIRAQRHRCHPADQPPQSPVSVLVLSAYDDDQYIFAVLDRAARPAIAQADVGADALVESPSGPWLRANGAGMPALPTGWSNHFARPDDPRARRSPLDQLTSES